MVFSYCPVLNLENISTVFLNYTHILILSKETTSSLFLFFKIHLVFVIQTQTIFFSVEYLPYKSLPQDKLIFNSPLLIHYKLLWSFLYMPHTPPGHFSFIKEEPSIVHDFTELKCTIQNLNSLDLKYQGGNVVSGSTRRSWSTKTALASLLACKPLHSSTIDCIQKLRFHFKSCLVLCCSSLPVLNEFSCSYCTAIAEAEGTAIAAAGTDQWQRQGARPAYMKS